MTESMSKNLKIEDGVAGVLKSSYKPYHLLCKPYLVEAFIDQILKYSYQLKISSILGKSLNL